MRLVDAAFFRIAASLEPHVGPARFLSAKPRFSVGANGLRCKKM